MHHSRLANTLRDNALLRGWGFSVCCSRQGFLVQYLSKVTSRLVPFIGSWILLQAGLTLRPTLSSASLFLGSYAGVEPPSLRVYPSHILL